MQRSRSTRAKYCAQHPSFRANTHYKNLELLLNKCPPKTSAFRVDDALHNLVVVAALVDAGCSVHLNNWGCEIDLEGETLCHGWREGFGSRLWRIKLTDDRTQRIQLDADLEDYDAISGIICMAIGYSANNIYKCQNKQHLIKYYHAALGSHPKQKLAAAAKKGYLKGLPRLATEAINKFIGIEDATERGYMRELPSGTRFTAKQTNRG